MPVSTCRGSDVPSILTIVVLGAMLGGVLTGYAGVSEAQQGANQDLLVVTPATRCPSRTCPLGLVDEWEWDFGHDSPIAEENESFDPNPDHPVAEPGEYTVRPRVTTTGDHTDTVERVVEID